MVTCRGLKKVEGVGNVNAAVQYLRCVDCWYCCLEAAGISTVVILTIVAPHFYRCCVATTQPVSYHFVSVVCTCTVVEDDLWGIIAAALLETSVR